MANTRGNKRDGRRKRCCSVLNAVIVSGNQAASQGMNWCHVAISSAASSAFLGGWLHIRSLPPTPETASKQSWPCDFVSQCEYHLHTRPLPLQHFAHSAPRQSMVVHTASLPSPLPLANPSGQL